VAAKEENGNAVKDVETGAEEGKEDSKNSKKQKMSMGQILAVVRSKVSSAAPGGKKKETSDSETKVDGDKLLKSFNSSSWPPFPNLKRNFQSSEYDDGPPLLRTSNSRVHPYVISTLPTASSSSSSSSSDGSDASGVCLTESLTFFSVAEYLHFLPTINSPNTFTSFILFTCHCPLVES
jgi:hypothetical protein